MEMSQKKSEKSQMLTELSFVSRMMKERIAPAGAAESKTERIRLAARKLKWKYSRAFSAWYADPRVSIKPSELRDVEEKSGAKFGQSEVEEIDELIAKANSLLERRNPHIRRAFFAAARSFLSALNRPGTEKRGSMK